MPGACALQVTAPGQALPRRSVCFPSMERIIVMSGSTFGTQFRITTWGESHGAGIGVVIDGCPAGLPLAESDVQPFLNRRKPGSSPFATPRKEDDAVTILSGVFEGRTTGTPISLLVANTNQHSADYSEIADFYRPGHADYTYDAKYGFRDYRGGGRSSGRETIGRVAAGAVAARLLAELGIQITAYSRSIGSVEIRQSSQELAESLAGSHSKQEQEAALLALRSRIAANNLAMPDEEAASRAESYLESCMARKDSAGGIIECIATGVPAGIGDPVFRKLDALLAQAIFSIGAVKGVEIGDGFASAQALGSTNNDGFSADDTGAIRKTSNHAGGVLGGISDGSPIILRAAIKPTPSIAAPQDTVTRDGKPVTVEIKGRHDPIIVPRAVVVVESMTALTLADLMLSNLGSTMDHLHRVYD